MGGHDGLGINHGKTRHLRGFLLLFVDPVCRQAKGGIGGCRADQRRRDAAGVDGQEHAGKRFALALDHAAQADPVGAGFELKVVAHMDRRRQKADVLRELAANALDPVEQVALPVLVDQRDQAVTQLQAEQVDWLQIVPGGLAIGRWSLDFFGHGFRWRRAVGQRPGAVTQHCCHAQEHHMRHAGHQA